MPPPTALCAPWSADQVACLNRNQQVPSFHPYTCANGPANHPANAVLVATTDGWTCPHCAYRQAWCHAFSATQDLTQLPGFERR